MHGDGGRADRVAGPAGYKAAYVGGDSLGGELDGAGRVNLFVWGFMMGRGTDCFCHGCLVFVLYIYIYILSNSGGSLRAD